MLKCKRNTSRFSELVERLQQAPCAMAKIKGSCEYPEIRGCVWFYETATGVMVASELHGLPEAAKKCGNSFFGFHIHEGSCCTGTADEPFADAGGHFNPDCCMHPEHAGDMPPFFGNDGYAMQIFLMNKYSIEDIIGRTVIIHRRPDDFTSQPSGNAGPMIACGEIKRFLCGR